MVAEAVHDPGQPLRFPTTSTAAMASHGDGPTTPARVPSQFRGDTPPASERATMPALPDPQGSQGEELLMLRNYTAELAALVRRVYAEDYELLGY